MIVDIEKYKLYRRVFLITTQKLYHVLTKDRLTTAPLLAAFPGEKTSMYFSVPDTHRKLILKTQSE